MQDYEVEFAPQLPTRSLEPLIARLQQRRGALEAQLSANPANLEARRELGRVDVALRWAAAGLYGTCTVCTDVLPQGQLETDPADTVCRSCREAAARSRRRIRKHVDARPLSLIDGPDALTRGFNRARSLARE